MKKIFAFGDSVMKGVTTDPELLSQGIIKYKVCENNFVNSCATFLGIPIENLSRFGSTITGGLSYLDRHFAKISAGDIVVLEFGGNDCNYNWAAISRDPEGEHRPQLTLEEFRLTYNRVLDRLEERKAVPVLLSLPELEPQLFFDHVTKGLDRENILRWLHGDIHTISNWHEQYNLEVFKIAARRNLRVIDISTAFLSQKEIRRYVCADGMHPNEEGHRLIAQAILRELSPAETRFLHHNPLPA